MRLPLLVTTLLLAVVPAASAATVQMRDEVEREGGRTYVYGVITVTAAPGEANAIDLAAEPGAVVVSDPGAPLAGDPRCTSVDAHTVRCDGSALDGITEVHADLGDGADRATALDPDRFGHLTIRGGAGDDTLQARWATLEGGEGDDVLRGDTGREVLHGEAGNDRLEGLGDVDYLHGGAGDDFIRGGDGHDTLLGGTAIGSDLPAGADTLIGDDGPNRLDGDRGRDVIRGGGGDDHLTSAVNPRENDPAAAASKYGPDRVSGGAGDDVIETLAALRSRIACDRGRDRVRLAASGPARGPLIGRSCERLTMARVTLDPFPRRITGRTLVFKVFSRIQPGRLAVRRKRVRGGHEFRIAQGRFAWRVVSAA